MESYKQLLLAVERTHGRSPKVRLDYDQLSLHIFNRTHSRISPTTLKRLFGYLNESVAPQLNTLHILAKYVGYADYNAFLRCTKGGTEETQSQILENVMVRSDELAEGTRLWLSWLPNRTCTVRHLGNKRFEVEEAVNTKLAVGDTFTCHLFIANEPLYFDHLIHRGSEPVAYVCGKKDGVIFEVLDAEG